jgi:hypothetical protein
MHASLVLVYYSAYLSELPEGEEAAEEEVAVLMWTDIETAPSLLRRIRGDARGTSGIGSVFISFFAACVSCSCAAGRGMNGGEGRRPWTERKREKERDVPSKSGTLLQYQRTSVSVSVQ